MKVGLDGHGPTIKEVTVLKLAQAAHAMHHRHVTPSLTAFTALVTVGCLAKKQSGSANIVRNLSRRDVI
jgi:hypothetical protein